MTLHDPTQVDGRFALPSLVIPTAPNRPINVSDVQHLFHHDKEWLPVVVAPKMKPITYHSEVDPNLSEYWVRKFELRARARQAVHAHRVVREVRTARTLPASLLSPRAEKRPLLDGCPAVEVQEICAIRAVLMPPVDLGQPELDVRWMDTLWLTRALRHENHEVDITFDKTLETFEEDWSDDIPKERALIDSPRSMLIMFRNGITIADLLKREKDYYRELSGTTRDPETVRALEAHCEDHRKELFSKLREQYRELCKRVSRDEFYDAIVQQTALEDEVRKAAKLRMQRKASVNSLMYTTRMQKEVERMERREEIHHNHCEAMKGRQRDLYADQLKIEAAIAQRNEERMKQMKARGELVRSVILEKQSKVAEHWETKKQETEAARLALEKKLHARTDIVTQRRENRRQRLRENMKRAVQKGMQGRQKVTEEKESQRQSVEQRMKANEILAEERRKTFDAERQAQLEKKHELEQQRLDIVQKVKEEQGAQHELRVHQQKALMDRIQRFVKTKTDEQCIQAQNLRRSVSRRLQENDEVDPRVQAELDRQKQRQAAQEERFRLLQQERLATVKAQAQHDRHDNVTKMIIRTQHLNEITFQNLCAKASELVKKEQREKQTESGMRLVKRTRHLRERMALDHQAFLGNAEEEMVVFRKQLFSEFLCKKDRVMSKSLRAKTSIL